VAQAAGDKRLVLSHFVPQNDPAVTDDMWIDAARVHLVGWLGFSSRKEWLVTSVSAIRSGPCPEGEGDVPELAARLNLICLNLWVFVKSCG